MSHLLAISIGPVQEFIAAGRRVGDLYAGSDLILQIARAAAQSLEASGATLIFPADIKAAAANKILAKVSGDPEQLAEAAERAAKNVLREAWQQALDRYRQVGSLIHTDLAEHQVNSFLEFYAAWWPESGCYPEDRRNVERLLAGRKVLRDFKQPQKNNYHKSPLDPSRDSVIRREGYTVPERAQEHPLRLKASEWLDAISILKRLQGREGRGPSTSDIAALSWLASPPEAARTRLAADPVANTALNQQPGAIFLSRRQELQEEGDLTEEQASAIAAVVGTTEPNPYFAILQADGDRIGEKLSTIDSPDQHQQFSRQLARFAEDARQIVERHRGHPVYTGGDDVLAFLPVHTALACGRALARAVAATGCTLSVGNAVVHYLSPLYTSLDYARAAEKGAKESGGNRLCLDIHTRGGEARRAFARWSSDIPAPDAASLVPPLGSWRPWIQAFRDGLSHGFPYELSALAREAQGSGIPGSALQEEVRRVYARKEGSQQSIDPLIAGIARAEDLQALAHRLIVLQWLSGYPLQWEETA